MNKIMHYDELTSNFHFGLPSKFHPIFCAHNALEHNNNKLNLILPKFSINVKYKNMKEK